MAFKRASPGAEDEKSPLQVAELNENAKKLEEIQRDLARAELVLERQAQAYLRPLYEKRREVIKTISNFWPVAMMNNSALAFYIQHSADKTALSYLEDIWVEKDAKEHRCFTIEFHFKENPIFSDRVLKKEYKYVPASTGESDTPDENGISEAMLDFSWDRDVEVSSTKINWTDPEKALTKLYPRKAGEDEDEIPADPGSFFNYFEYTSDPMEVGVVIANEVFPESIEYFLGNVDNEISDSEDEDDEDDDAEEIDLEKPRAKKARV